MHNLHALAIPILRVEIKIIIPYKTLKVYSNPKYSYWKMYFWYHDAVYIPCLVRILQESLKSVIWASPIK